MLPQRSSLVQHMIEIEKLSKDHNVSLSEIVRVLGDEGHFLLILFFVLPFLQPIPLFGLSTPFGILISVVALLFYLKRPPFVPARWRHKKISKATAFKIAQASEYFFKRLEKILKPRFKTFFSEPFRTLNISIIVVNAILLALPLPVPFSNAMPAYAIFFQTIAYLEKDGAAVLLSYVQALLSAVFFILVGYGTVTGVNYLNL